MGWARLGWSDMLNLWRAKLPPASCSASIPPELGLLVHKIDTGSGDADEAVLDGNKSVNVRFAQIIS